MMGRLSQLGTRIVRQYVASKLAKRASGSLLLNVFSKGITLITSIVLTRVLGKTDFGHYAYAISWATLLTFPAMLGLNTLLTREVARFNALDKWRELRGLLRWSDAMIVGSSSIIGAGGFVVLWWFRDQLAPGGFAPLAIAVCVIPLGALLRTRQASILGFGHIVTGQMPQMFIQPLLFISAILLLGLTRRLDAAEAMVVRVIVIVIALLVAIILQQHFMPAEARAAKPNYQSKLWLMMGLTFMAGGTISVVNEQLSVIMVGSLLGPDETALYEVARKGADFITFVPAAIYLTIGPSVARHFARDEHQELQELLVRSVRWSVISAAVPGVFFIFFGKYYLLLYGVEFVEARDILYVLTLTSLVFVCFGPTSLILNMTGHERYTAVGVLISTLINAVLTLVLVRYYSVVGAAMAQLISVLVYKIGLTTAIYKLMNLRSFLRFY